MPNDAPPVTFHVALAPSDLRHARHVLPHQLRVWSGQVREIVCTLDVLKAFGPPHEDGRALAELVDECLAPYPHARRVTVDPSDATRASVGAAWFEHGEMPRKDWRGTAFYSYFYGWQQATQPYVLHADSDMVYGGGSQTWTSEAVAFLETRPDVLACQPLMAPPTADGDLRGKKVTREPCSSVAYRWTTNFSSQCFLMNMRGFIGRVGLLTRVPHTPARERVTLLRWLKAMPMWNVSDVRRPLTLRYPDYEWAEVHIAEAMKRAGLCRVSLLGSEPGMWMVHPGHRTERVYEVLEALIECVEQGELPEEQRGRWNMEEATMDWLSDRDVASVG